MLLLKRLSIILLFTASLSVLAFDQTEPLKTIEIGVLPGLQFSVVRFAVKPGEQVKLVLDNTDDMSHNLLITLPGTREKVVEMANKLGESGPAASYIPETSDVLWSIPVTDPEKANTLVFKAPEKEGVYPYVCTYPGHGTIMYGAMYVSNSGEMPELTKDLNIPESRREGKVDGAIEQGHVHEKPVLHPYTPVPPYHYRVFIDRASPAAIAVALPNDVSYCWDAGTGYLRFAWWGGFLDNSDLWKGKGNAEAKVIGKVFFRSKRGFPISIGNKKRDKVVYKGYQLKKRYPEFHYQIDGTDVYELIHEAPDGTGLERIFRIPDAAAPVTFDTSPNEGVTYSASAGLWKGNVLQLTTNEARSFTVTMKKMEE